VKIHAQVGHVVNYRRVAHVRESNFLRIDPCSVFLRLFKMQQHGAFAGASATKDDTLCGFNIFQGVDGWMAYEAF